MLYIVGCAFTVKCMKNFFMKGPPMSQEPSSVAASQPNSYENQGTDQFQHQGTSQYHNQGTGQYNTMQAAMVYQKSAQQVDAEKASQASLIWGILGLFVLPFVLGPIAIIQANKAERLGAAATVGKVLGWIDTVIGVLGILIMIVMLVTLIGAGSAVSN